MRLEMSPARRSEVARWLQKQIGLDEAVGMFTAIDAAAGEEPIDPVADEFRQWVGCNREPNDELWWYDTGGTSWEDLCGQCGFALVRDGGIVDAFMVIMN